MKVMILGSNGQLGKSLKQYFQKTKYECYFFNRSDLDINDHITLNKKFISIKPDIIINSCAYTAVDKAEENFEEANNVNNLSVGMLAQQCLDNDCFLIHISTDYVFDGAGSTAFAPGHHTCPLGAYGRSKRTGEQGVMAAGGHYVILRTAWVFSRHGTNFLKTMLRLSATRDQLKIVNDQFGGPTPAAAIAAACHSIAGGLATGTGRAGVYHFSGTPEVSWADFAAEIFAQSARQVTITGIATQDYPTPAQRPLNSRLNCDSLRAQFGLVRPDWRAGLGQLCADIEVI